tara:strand:- start:729 stop:1079 length:351 start_codon:yes stop_codon:yes gene_type:complete
LLPIIRLELIIAICQLLPRAALPLPTHLTYCPLPRLMLGAARRAVEGDRMGRTGAWDFWSPSSMVGKQVTGQRLEIVGMGHIGQAMAPNASDLGMDVHYYNRNPLPDDLAQGATYH